MSDKNLDPCLVTDLETAVGESFNGMCWQKKADGKRCRQLTGWGTAHPGVGPCKHHGGIPQTPSIIESELQPLDSYAGQIKNERLRDLVMAAERGNALDSLNPEIALMKGLIGLLAEGIGLKLISHPETGELLYVEQPEQLEDQVKDLVRVINTLTNSYKTKYAVLIQMKEAIPRSEVRTYVEAIQNVLSKNLRDDCPKCHAKIGLMTAVFDDLAALNHL